MIKRPALPVAVFARAAMVIVPCSMGTVGRINAGVAMDLIERCADVHLKERRPLVIAPREMPFNLIHLRNLTALAEAGATIAPPIPAWYTQPKTLDDMIDFVVRFVSMASRSLSPRFSAGRAPRMSRLQRLLLLPVPGPIAVVVVVAVQQRRPGSERLLTWTLRPLPMGAWIALAAAGSALF